MGRAAHLTRDELEEQEAIALLGLCLTPCQWSVMRRLLAHPLLSDAELAAFLSLHRSSVRCSLYALHQLGCLEPIPTQVGKRWHLCGRGLRLIATANQVHVRNWVSCAAPFIPSVQKTCAMSTMLAVSIMLNCT